MSEKSEQPTSKRLRDARAKGDVCKSEDVSSAFVVLVLVLYFLLMAPSMLKALQDMLNLTLQWAAAPYEEALPRIWGAVWRTSLEVLLPLLALVMTGALVSRVMQVGMLFSLHSIIPNLENLSPERWFKKVFSLRNAVDLGKNILKVTVLGLAVWQVLQGYLPALFTLPRGTVWDMWLLLGRAARDVGLTAGVAFGVIAALDYLFQRWQYTKDHMMTKDEVKREFKEMEGDPQIKGKRKQLHREVLAQNTLDNVRRAKVLVVNPTHYAVALDYEKGKTPLPVVLAKGEGMLAQRMIDLARQEGIPVMRHVSLARDLFEQGTENACIPQEFIAPVAEVLRWVQSLQKT